MISLDLWQCFEFFQKLYKSPPANFGGGLERIMPGLVEDASKDIPSDTLVALRSINLFSKIAIMIHFPRTELSADLILTNERRLIALWEEDIELKAPFISLDIPHTRTGNLGLTQ